MKKGYEPPVVVELGSLHELTLGFTGCPGGGTNKVLGRSDGLTFLDQPIRCS